MKKVVLLFFSVLLSASEVSAQQSEAGGLARVFEPGWILQDRNGDEQVDFVAVRLVVPDEPLAEEVAAAATVAARLGYETSGLSLPLVFTASEVETASSDDPLIVIGSSNPLIPALVGERIEALSPQQGLIAFEEGRVVIVGKDPTGTRAAAEAFASRSPYLWEIIGRENGETHQKIASQLADFLGEGGVAVSEVLLKELVYQKERPEAVSVTFEIGLASGDSVKARDLLASVRDAHALGEQTDRLNYSSAAQVIFRLADDTATETVSIPRMGMPQRILTPPRRIPPQPPDETGEPQKKEERVFDLSDLFTIRGLFEDTDEDRIPDVTSTVLVLPAAAEASKDLPPHGTAHLAARIGLESTGMSFPLIQLDRDIEDADDEPTLILLGGMSGPAEHLRRLGKRRYQQVPFPGRGIIEVVPNAFGKEKIVPAVVVTADDREGAEAASGYLAGRAPYLWAARRGESTLDDVEESVRGLLDGRTAAGQAALAVAWLDEAVKGLEEKELEKVEVEFFLEEPSPELDRFLAEELEGKLTADEIEIKSRGRREPEIVFEETPELEWEVDHFWKIFRDRALPNISAGSQVSVELRVSESPELRGELATQIGEEIAGKGGEAAEVRVLSAYKQGFSWLVDEVAPAIESRPVARIEIEWKPFPVDPSKKWRFHPDPSRWMNALYPVDDVLSQKLGIPISAFSFSMKEDGDWIYRVTATDSAGTVIHQDTFSPKFYERPYLDAFPAKAGVTVTTGWLTVRADGKTLVDERIPTDLDRVWEHYQSSSLEKVYEDVQSSTGGKPTRDKQPFFNTLRFELKASEPDYSLGVDEELVTSLESIHDDVYFDTLDFFYEVVEEAEGEPIPSRRLGPGNILPWIHPERRGEPPELTVTYSKNASRNPKVVLKYTVKGEEEKSESQELEPVKLPRPSAYLAEVEAEGEALARLELLVILEDAEPLPRLADLLDNLTRLREEGIFREALSFAGLSELGIRLEAPGAVSTRNYVSYAEPEEEAVLAERAPVTWDHVVSPEESESVAASLGTLPEVTTYVAGRSYQGRPVSVMEIRLPMEAELVSQAKLSTWKPVLSLMGRQHANEVSSTSHILRLSERLATNPDFQRYLKHINFVVQPVVNPDGAALAFELQKLTPLHCLHAGRYSALGPDVPREANNPDTLVTEALVLNKVANTWVPDIQLNPHGYPTHEWVQTFANYNPKGFRSYWIPRGWYTVTTPIEDPRYPHHQEVAQILRDYIGEEISRDPESREVNLRIYDRYQRWAIRWQPHVYNLEIHDDTAIYHTRRTSTAQRADPRDSTMVFSGFTEAMDETAQGEWLDLVSRMGFGYLMASVRFLEEAEVELYRLEEERDHKVKLSLTRPRPLKPKR